MNFRILVALAGCSALVAAAPAQAHGRHHHHHHHHYPHGMTAKHDRMADHKISDSDHHNNDPTSPATATTSH